jgi:hypothetical protein
MSVPLRRSLIAFSAVGAIGTIVLAMQGEGRHLASLLSARRYTGAVYSMMAVIGDEHGTHRLPRLA